MRRVASLAVVAIGLIGFVGCGGGGGGTSDTSTADSGGGPPSAPAAPGAPGPASSGGPSYDSAMMNPSASPSGAGAENTPDEAMEALYDPAAAEADLGSDPAMADPDGALYTPDEALPPGQLDLADGYDPAGEYDPSGLGQRANAAPLTYAEKADLAFREGRDREAMLYVYAHGLAADTGPADNLERIKWSPGLRRPSVAVRWGVGIEYSAPKNYKGEPMAAGTKQTLPQRSNRGGGQAGGAGAGGYDAEGGLGADPSGFGGGGGGKSTNPTLKKYTGDIGEKFMERLREHIGRGDYGAVLASAMEGPQDNRGANQFGDDEYMDGAEYDPGLGSGGSSGRFAVGGGGAAAGDEEGKADRPQQLAPGVLLLGLGNHKELMMKAQDNDIDLLAIFTVDVRPNARLRLIQNETRIELHDVATEKRIARTKEINNVAVQVANEDESKDNPIDPELDDLFVEAETQYKMGPLPEVLAAEHVLARVESLKGKTYKNPLPVLTEIQFFNQAKLLDDNSMAAAFIEIVGKETAESLVRGTLDEKKEALKPFLPEEKEVAQNQNLAGPGRPGGSGSYGPGRGAPGSAGLDTSTSSSGSPMPEGGSRGYRPDGGASDSSSAPSGSPGPGRGSSGYRPDGGNSGSSAPSGSPGPGSGSGGYRPDGGNSSSSSAPSGSPGPGRGYQPGNNSSSGDSSDSSSSADSSSASGDSSSSSSESSDGSSSSSESS